MQSGDRVLGRPRNRRREQRDHLRLDAEVARKLVDAELLLADGAAIREVGGRHRHVKAHAIHQRGRRRRTEQLLALGDRGFHRQLRAHETRRFVARTDRLEGILGSDGLRWERQQKQRSQRGGNESNQADSPVATRSRGSSGTTGISGGYGSASVALHSPTESSRPALSSPINSCWAISAWAARSIASLFTYIRRQSSM